MSVAVDHSSRGSIHFEVHNVPRAPERDAGESPR